MVLLYVFNGLFVFSVEMLLFCSEAISSISLINAHSIFIASLQSDFHKRRVIQRSLSSDCCLQVDDDDNVASAATHAKSCAVRRSGHPRPNQFSPSRSLPPPPAHDTSVK